LKSQGLDFFTKEIFDPKEGIIFISNFPVKLETLKENIELYI
jgi:hypothetical protein